MEDIKKQVGAMIREARKAKGITQKELGEKLGIDEARVSRLENGRHNITLETAGAIFDTLGVTIKLVSEK